jgi:hypothetical protein
MALSKPQINAMLDGKLELEKMRNEVMEKAKDESVANNISGRKHKVSTKNQPKKTGLAALKEIMNLPGVNMSPKAKRAYARMQEEEIKRKQQQTEENK